MVRAIHMLAYAALLAVALGKQMVRFEDGGQVSRLMRKSLSDFDIDSTQEQAAAVPADPADAAVPADTEVPADTPARQKEILSDEEHAQTEAANAETLAKEAQEMADTAKKEEADAPVATVDEDAAKADSLAKAAEAGAKEAKEALEAAKEEVDATGDLQSPAEVDATATVDAEAATAEKEAEAADAEATSADAIADEAAETGAGEGAAEGEADPEWQDHLAHLHHSQEVQATATNLHHLHRAELTYHYMEEELPSACHSHYEDLGTHLSTGECAKACFESVGCERFSAGGCSLGCRISVVGQNAPAGSPAAEHGQCPTHAAVEASGGDAGQCVVYKLSFYHATSMPGACQNHYELVDGVNANDKAHCAHACKNTPGCTRFSAGPECETGGCRISKCGNNDGGAPCPADEQCTIGVESGCAMYEVFR